MAKFTGKNILKLGTEGSIITIEKEGKSTYLKTHFDLSEIKATPMKSKVEMAKQNAATDDPASGEELYTPKPEDLTRHPFRALTATVVAAGTWRATDFTNEAVLKRSMKKLIGKTAFTEHWQNVNNNIGVIEAATWSQASVQNGIKVPAGIDIVYLIDAKRNEDLVRSLLMPIPSIYSNSVTVEYEWEPTHDDFTDADDFDRYVGKEGPDGRMIARKVIDIIDYHESSILWMGADPFAKMIGKDGKLINIDEGSVFEQSTEYTKDAYKKDRYYMAAYSFRKDDINLKQEVQTETIMEKELLAAVKLALGLKADDVVTATHLAQFASMKLVKDTDHSVMVASLGKVTELEKEVTELKSKGTDPALKAANETLTKDLGVLKTEKETLTKEKDELTKEVATMKPLVDVAKEHLTKKVTEVERLYRASLADGKAVDEALLTKIKAADSKELDSFLNLFTDGATEKFDIHCEDCQSTKISMRSTFAADPKGGDPKGEVKRSRLADHR